MTREEAIEELLCMKHIFIAESDADKALDMATEALKEQKTSQLITNGIGVRYCSNCRRIDDKYSVANFCWYCGAKYER